MEDERKWHEKQLISTAMLTHKRTARAITNQRPSLEAMGILFQPIEKKSNRAVTSPLPLSLNHLISSPLTGQTLNSCCCEPSTKLRRACPKRYPRASVLASHTDNQYATLHFGLTCRIELFAHDARWSGCARSFRWSVYRKCRSGKKSISHSPRRRVEHLDAIVEQW